MNVSVTQEMVDGLYNLILIINTVQSMGMDLGINVQHNGGFKLLSQIDEATRLSVDPFTVSPDGDAEEELVYVSGDPDKTFQEGPELGQVIQLNPCPACNTDNLLTSNQEQPAPSNLAYYNQANPKPLSIVP